jgi:threonylcarbamoyl-AMP synthase-like protein
MRSIAFAALTHLTRGAQIPYGQNISPGSDSLFWRENSLLPRKFSLIPSKNSLFRRVGNFGILPQALECTRGLGSEIASGGRILQNSLLFSLYRCGKWMKTIHVNDARAGTHIPGFNGVGDHLRALDACGAAVIAVMPVPRIGLGEAINDRLWRAAAPR